MARGKSRKRKEFHEKIKEKENKIRRSRKGDKVNFSEDEVLRVMKKYGIDDYRVTMWGDVIVKSKFSNWRISIDPDEEVVFLHHENERLARIGNYRSKYHIHNVFYDLDFCVKSIVEHDSFKVKPLVKKSSKQNTNINQGDNSP